MLDTVRVDAVTVGVDAQPGSLVTLRNSVIHALEAVRGTVTLRGLNDLSLPPLNVLGAIGLPLIVLSSCSRPCTYSVNAVSDPPAATCHLPSHWAPDKHVDKIDGRLVVYALSLAPRMWK